MTISYDYDPDAAGHADDNASRIDHSGPYIGQFKMAHAMTSSKGTEGIRFEFGVASSTVTLDLWTRKEDGTAIFGNNFLQGMMAILGLKGLTSTPGKFMAYDSDAGKRVEVAGDIFPGLMSKPIGLILQKELTTRSNGQDGYRMNIYGVFHPDTKLTASEIKERKTTPENFAKMCQSVKDKDSRTQRPDEPSQPGVGAAGGY